jgi:hypothetical protein
MKQCMGANLKAKLISTLSVLVIAMLGGCDLMNHTRCDDKILTHEKSPDGKYVAILYQRSCANNTGLYTCVNIQETPGNFSKGETQPILTISGFHEIRAIWTSPNTLEIQSEGLKLQKAILTQEERWKSVSIHYKY